jgi:DNA modification methylase
MSNKTKVEIQYLDPSSLNDYKRQLRIPNKNQIEKSKQFLGEFGFSIPAVIDKNKTIIIGGHLVEAARQLKWSTIPCVQLEHMSEESIRMLRIAYDRLAEDADWDKGSLLHEFQELELIMPELDLTLSMFETEEIELILDLDSIDEDDALDAVPEIDDSPAITKEGDIWIMGKHKLLCGDSLNGESYQKLMDNQKAQMVFTDAPYNVKIDGHVGNSGETKHEEFAMASGEMSDDVFTEFLATVHQHIATYSTDGAIIFSCMDWRHITHIATAAMTAKLSMINLCVWSKDNGGMGSLYRSQHELVFVFKNGSAKHINNVQLGSNGRYRTNVWNYPGVNSFGSGRMDELKMHPTVKPTAMVVDAIKDCSNRGGVILDPFGGSGTTLIAADQCARQARLIELSPHYCDVTVRRWQDLTGSDAIHSKTGKKFNEIQNEKGA